MTVSVFMFFFMVVYGWHSFDVRIVELKNMAGLQMLNVFALLLAKENIILLLYLMNI